MTQIGINLNDQVRIKSNEVTPFGLSIWETGTVTNIDKNLIAVKLKDDDLITLVKSNMNIYKMDIDTDSKSNNNNPITNISSHNISKNTSKTVQSFNYNRGRREWDPNETKTLINGILKYKNFLENTKPGTTGIWSMILNDNQFKHILKHRTNQMLKDRYRVLKSQGLI